MTRSALALYHNLVLLSLPIATGFVFHLFFSKTFVVKEHGKQPFLRRQELEIMSIELLGILESLVVLAAVPNTEAAIPELSRFIAG